LFAGVTTYEIDLGSISIDSGIAALVVEDATEAIFNMKYYKFGILTMLKQWPWVDSYRKALELVGMIFQVSLY